MSHGRYARPTATFPVTEFGSSLTGTKLYRLVTEETKTSCYLVANRQSKEKSVR